MTDGPKFFSVLKVVTVACIVLAAIMQIAVTVQSIESKWFANDVKGGTYFYILRVYTTFFCVLAVLAEFPSVEFFHDSFKIFRYAFGRGFLYVFVGFLTVTGNMSKGSETIGTFSAVVGYILCCIGLVNCVTGCLCMGTSPSSSSNAASLTNNGNRQGGYQTVSSGNATSKI